MSPARKKGLAVGALLSVVVACGGCALSAAPVAPSVAGAFPVVAENLGGGRAEIIWKSADARRGQIELKTLGISLRRA